MKLYHASIWSALASAPVGACVVLRPGTQGAEGAGVYFAEGMPRPSASDSCHLARGIAAIVAISAPEDGAGWWRTKAGLARKFGRPRSWHSQGKSISLRVLSRLEHEGIPLLECEWQFV